LPEIHCHHPDLLESASNHLEGSLVSSPAQAGRPEQTKQYAFYKGGTHFCFFLKLRMKTDFKR